MSRRLCHCRDRSIRFALALTFRSARLPEDAALLIHPNAEYLPFVFEGATTHIGVTLADIFTGGDIRACLLAALPKTLGPGPPESRFYILEQGDQPIGMGGARNDRSSLIRRLI